MDDYRRWSAEDDDRAIRFTGTWREYLPIAVTNVLLIIVTLGVYRFWATARQRRYLWSRTHIIDDSLEWTGTGKEMFLGFLMVVAFLLPFFLFIQFLFPALVARGKEAAAGGLMALAMAAVGDLVSPRERGRYQGYIAATFAVATAPIPSTGIL